MTLSPLDLPAQQFRTAVRGFDRKEVAEFLAELAADYEEALHVADRLRDEVARTDALLVEQRETEHSLRATMLTAQKLADEIRHTAEQESERIIADAQARAATLAQHASPQLDSLADEIAALRARRDEAAASLESTLATLRATLERVRLGG